MVCGRFLGHPDPSPRDLPRIGTQDSASGFGIALPTPHRARLSGRSRGQDFGGLFIGFSFFLILSALLLLNLVFRFGIERRVQEVGTLLALGWTPKATARLFFREGLLLAALGATLGTGGGLLYGQAVLMGLNTLWRMPSPEPHSISIRPLPPWSEDGWRRCSWSPGPSAEP